MPLSTSPSSYITSTVPSGWTAVTRPRYQFEPPRYWPSTRSPTLTALPSAASALPAATDGVGDRRNVLPGIPRTFDGCIPVSTSPSSYMTSIAPASLMLVTRPRYQTPPPRYLPSTRAPTSTGETSAVGGSSKEALE